MWEKKRNLIGCMFDCLNGRDSPHKLMIGLLALLEGECGGE